MQLDSKCNILNDQMFRSNSSAEYIARASKVVTLVDLAGHERYFKTTAYGLTGHMPDYACLIVGANAGLLTAALHPSSHVSAVCQVRLQHCVAAACQSDTFSIAAHMLQRYLSQEDSCDSTFLGCLGSVSACWPLRVPRHSANPAGIVGMCKEHMGVALALKVPVFFVVTKVDICPEHVLKHTLATLQAILKKPGVKKKPFMVSLRLHLHHLHASLDTEALN